MTVVVSALTVVDAATKPLIDSAFAGLAVQRGGPGLLRDLKALIGGDSPEAVFDELVSRGAVRAATADGVIQGFIAIDPLARRTVLSIYVAPAWRRRGVATALITSLSHEGLAPVDAWALPGDRAMKSLYEKMGWRARRLTMSAE